MFVTVKFGEEQQEIFNPGCRNDILLHYIKERCRVKQEDVVDLSDERGIIKNLRHFPHDYASSYLKNRETLILLRVESSVSLQSSPDDMTVEKATFIPLLSSLVTNTDFIGKANTDFIDMLNPAKDDDTMSEASVKSRRRSSMMDLDDTRNGRAKPKGPNSGGIVAKKPSSRRGPRPPLRKTANAS